MDSNIYPLTLYYDSHCPICHAEIHNLMQRNQAEKLRFVDLHGEGFVPPAGLSQQQLLARLHAKCADGTVVHSLAAFRLIYQAVGLGWVANFTRWPLLRRFMDAFYPVFARHRHRLLPRLIATAIFNCAARRAVKKRCDRSGRCAITPPLSSKE